MICGKLSTRVKAPEFKCWGIHRIRNNIASTQQDTLCLDTQCQTKSKATKRASSAAKALQRICPGKDTLQSTASVIITPGYAEEVRQVYQTIRHPSQQNYYTFPEGWQNLDLNNQQTSPQ